MAKYARITHGFGYEDVLKGETKKQYVTHITHIEAPDMTRLRAMAKSGFVADYKKLSYEKNHIEIELSDGKVDIYKEREYSGDFPESSKEYTEWTVVRALRNKKVVRELKLNIKTKLNPLFEDRPTCDFCYKQTTKVTKTNLLDEAKTEIKACKACVRDLDIMRNL